MKEILVGIDGSHGSKLALDRALRLAQRTGRPVMVVHAWNVPTPPTFSLGIGYMYDPFPVREDARSAATTLLDTEVAEGLARLASDSPVTVHTCLREGSVGHEIVDAAEGSALVLLGTQGHGRLGGLLGSAVPFVLHHASCPVMVVPAVDHAGTFRRVVVGLDGSDAARTALLWGYELARLDGTPLQVLHAVPLGDQPVDLADEEVWNKEVFTTLPPEPEVAVDVTLVPGKPDDVLTGAVGPDDLLVVGSRGAGTFTGALLGSVASTCIAHPEATVLVVKPHEEGLAHLFGPAHDRNQED